MIGRTAQFLFWTCSVFCFDFQFQCERFDSPEAQLAFWIRGGREYPEQTYSLISVSHPQVLLWALKPAEDGGVSDIIARVWHLGSQPQKYSVSLASGVKSARRVTHIETDIEALEVAGGQVANQAQATQIQTMRLAPQ